MAPASTEMRVELPARRDPELPPALGRSVLFGYGLNLGSGPTGAAGPRGVSTPIRVLPGDDGTVSPRFAFVGLGIVGGEFGSIVGPE